MEEYYAPGYRFMEHVRYCYIYGMLDYLGCVYIAFFLEQGRICGAGRLIQHSGDDGFLVHWRIVVPLRTMVIVLFLRCDVRS